MSKRILLVEDNALHRKLFASWLAMGGYDPTVLADERSLQALAEELRPDGIVVDIRLPFIGGLDIIEGLKASPVTRAIPVLALTVLTTRADEEACYAAGADAYLAKPARIEEFLTCMGKLTR